MPEHEGILIDHADILEEHFYERALQAHSENVAVSEFYSHHQVRLASDSTFKYVLVVDLRGEDQTGCEFILDSLSEELKFGRQLLLLEVCYTKGFRSLRRLRSSQQCEILGGDTHKSIMKHIQQLLFLLIEQCLHDSLDIDLFLLLEIDQLCLNFCQLLRFYLLCVTF